MGEKYNSEGNAGPSLAIRDNSLPPWRNEEGGGSNPQETSNAENRLLVMILSIFVHP